MNMFYNSFSCFVATSSLLIQADIVQPNFIFIFVDDMGWTGTSTQIDPRISDSMSDFYETPNLDKLAKDGMVFSNAYSSASMCTPSRASVLTGKSPAQLHITTPGPVQSATATNKVIPAQHETDLQKSELTIAEVLKKKGYATAHLGKWHLKGDGPGCHGFDVHDGETGNGGPGNYTGDNPKDIFGITSHAEKFMEEQVKSGKPFYLQLSHYAVHSPELALSETISEFEDKTSGKRHSSVKSAAMTKDFDTSVGMILGKVKSLGIIKNSYIIFMSDNGAAGGVRRPNNAPLSGGKGTLSEGGIRVPLIVSGPHIKKNSNSSVNIIGYDLFPTICELAGVSYKSLPKKIEGKSFSSVLNGKEDFNWAKRELIFHNPHYGKGAAQLPQSAIIAGKYKLLRDYESGKDYLYNLSKDIGEKKDLSLSQTSILKKMSVQLTHYLKKIHAQIPIVNKDYNSSAVKSSNKFINRCDKDGDGKVSKGEFRGPSHHFDDFDKNSDGFISSDEAPTRSPKK